MNQPPVILPRQRVDISLPQEPNIVSLLQLLDRTRIMSDFQVVHLDRPHISVPSAHRLDLTLAPQLMRNCGRGDAQRQQYQKDRNHQPQQEKALLSNPHMLAIASFRSAQSVLINIKHFASTLH